MQSLVRAWCTGEPVTGMWASRRKSMVRFRQWVARHSGQCPTLVVAEDRAAREAWRALASDLDVVEHIRHAPKTKPWFVVVWDVNDVNGRTLWAPAGTPLNRRDGPMHVVVQRDPEVREARNLPPPLVPVLWDPRQPPNVDPPLPLSPSVDETLWAHLQPGGKLASGHPCFDG